MYGMDMRNGCISMIEARLTSSCVVTRVLVRVLCFVVAAASCTNGFAVIVRSPDGRNFISLDAAGDKGDKGGELQLVVGRDKRTLITGSSVGAVLSTTGLLARGAQIVDVQNGKLDERFELPWGKTKSVADRCSTAVVTLAGSSKIRWQIE